MYLHCLCSSDSVVDTAVCVLVPLICYPPYRYDSSWHWRGSCQWLCLHNIFGLAAHVLVLLGSLLACIFSDDFFYKFWMMGCMLPIACSCVTCLDSETSEYECAPRNCHDAFPMLQHLVIWIKSTWYFPCTVPVGLLALPYGSSLFDDALDISRA